MNTLTKIIKKISALARKASLMARIAILRKQKMVFLFCSPFHPNMGDHAQTYCIQKWYKENYPDYGMLILQSTVCSKKILNLIRKFIRPNDKLVCHSGYHLTNIYNEQRVYFWVIQHFRDFPIIIFPQTINYTIKDSLTEACDVLNSHPHLTLMCRDERSYRIALENFSQAKLLLYPDIVTSLIGTRTYFAQRKGVLFCMRNDVEAYYKPKEIANLRCRLVSEYTSMTDTDRFDFSMSYIYKHREKVLNKVIEEFSHYKVVVTDRYHGTIFSQITGTPVVVLGSTDHKLSSGVKWFPKEIFDKYVFFANDLETAYELVISILENYEKYDHKIPAYFKEKYYDQLKEMIEKK